MRNLKKFLALVLALMMTFSLMVTANAAIDTNAAVTDKDSITEEFKEAVAVLNGLKIITGYEDGTFRPDKNISRQEATALVYRLHSGDVEDTRNDLYSTADNIKQFKDVDPNGAQQWSAGYIGYCANQGIIKGVSGTRFAPTSNVTGYQVLAMVLRAIGYGQNGEYEGTGWQTRVATTATKLGILKNINNTNYAATLSAPATRELVAEIIFQAAIQPTVTYTPSLGYIYETAIDTVGKYGSLAYKNFYLRITNWTSVDEWGRPGYYWYTDRNNQGFALSRAVATITPVATKEYTDVQRECDVAHDLKIESDKNFSLFVNSKTALTNSYKIVATDTVTKVGGQGRLTEVYYDYSRPWNNTDNGAIIPGSSSGANTVVMIDTMLAYVKGKSDAVLDKADHIITPAKLDVTIYDGNVKTSDAAAATNGSNVYSNKTISKPNTSKDNWNDYSVGDYILIYAYTDQNKLNVHATDDAKEKAAFETNKVVTTTTGYPSNTLVQGTNVWVQKKADVKQGKQTVTYWNQGKHQIDGQDYPDQLTLFLDKAGTNVNTTYNWYFDLYGNVIGIAEATGSRYGVITSIYAAVSQGESDTTGGIKAMANVKFTDGTTSTVAVDKFLVTNNNDSTITWNPTTAVSRNIPNVVLAEGGDNTAELQPRYDTVNNNPLTARASSFTSTLAKSTGFLYLAPSSVTNDEAHFGATNFDQYGILYNHMFEFRSVSDESVIAIEVAGTNANTGVYAGNRNYTLARNLTWGKDSDREDITSSYSGILHKGLGVLSLGYPSASGPEGATVKVDVKLDSSTQILIRSGAWGFSADWTKILETGKGTISAYTLATLPGDIELNLGTEADWVDANNDGVAEYVYIQADVAGKVTYGLFYYNGDAAQWNGKEGTIQGYLNGQYTTVTFDDYDDFYVVQNSADYKGHLFALQITDGVVSCVMEGVNDKGDFTGTTYSSAIGKGQKLLWNNVNNTDHNGRNIAIYDSAAHAGNMTSEHAHIRTRFAGNEANFQVGSSNGNPYTKDTKAVYYRDTHGNTATGTDTNVSYNWNSRAITVSGGASAVYYLAADAVIVGNLENLDLRTCDVTMIYEESKTTLTKSVREIYISTDDSDWTPNGGVTNPPAPPASGSITGDVAEAPIPAGTTIFANPGLLNPYFIGLDNKVVSLPGTVTNIGEAATVSNVRFFPFYANNGTGDALLEITNSSGTVVWREYATSGAVTQGWHAFRIDITGTNVNATTCVKSMDLTTATETYSFTVSYGGTPVSTGSFVYTR